jgi:hypothetical protein
VVPPPLMSDVRDLYRRPINLVSCPPFIFHVVAVESMLYYCL